MKIFHGNNRPHDSLSWDYFFQKGVEKVERPNFRFPLKSWLNWGPLNVEDDQMQDFKVVEWVKSELKIS